MPHLGFALFCVLMSPILCIEASVMYRLNRTTGDLGTKYFLREDKEGFLDPCRQGMLQKVLKREQRATKLHCLSVSSPQHWSRF
jgi:hypothetical protein